VGNHIPLSYTHNFAAYYFELTDPNDATINSSFYLQYVQDPNNSNKHDLFWGWDANSTMVYSIDSTDRIDVLDDSPSGLGYLHIENYNYQTAGSTLTTDLMVDNDVTILISTCTGPDPNDGNRGAIGRGTVADGNLSNLTPNPASDNAWLQFSAPLNTSYQMEVRDMQGKLYQTKTIQAGALHAQIDVANLPDGMYVISLQNAKERIVKKLMVAR
ncbi:MAG: T9SS type A sorting domain-containing protein, partial [Bdellovibrionota bacterium]